MSEIVLDSSVLIAILKNERVHASTFEIIEGAVISTVSLAEITSTLSDLGMTSFPRTAGLLALLDRIEPFTSNQANLCGSLRAPTRHAGLSLGDRSCLALALELGADVYTADRAWARVDVGCRIHLVR